MDKILLIAPVIFLVLLTGAGIYSTENPILIALFWVSLIYAGYKSF